LSVNLSAWLGDAGDLAALPTATAAQRAALAWRRINDKPSSVTFRTPAGVTLPAKTVRIEPDSTAGMATSEAGMGQVRKVVVFGVRGHVTVSDTDIDDGYRFVYQGDEYRCVGILTTLGEVQGYFESVS
jgi:hypothetical protein